MYTWDQTVTGNFQIIQSSHINQDCLLYTLSTPLTPSINSYCSTQLFYLLYNLFNLLVTRLLYHDSYA